MINYAVEGPKWTTPVVTWSFSTAGNAAFTNAIGSAYQGVIRAAAAQWAAVANLTLQEVAPGTSGTSITVGWGSFGGTQIGQTAYSYSLGATQAFQPGMTIQIEDPALLALASSVGATYAGTATTLAQVALHEFGHALGLGLSTDPNSVMNLRLGPTNTTLDASDLAGITALYGAKPGNATIAAANSSNGPDTVPLGGNDIGVYRYFDSSNGTQFLTSSPGEMNGISAQRPDLKFEGLALAAVAPGTADLNASPVYRFFDTRNGTHFFTASSTEAAGIIASRADLIEEQASFDEHLTQQPGDVAVFRFFDNNFGTHFFTSNASESAAIAATRADMTYEGVAFYAPALG